MGTKAYEEALGGFSDDERQAWLELGKMFKTSPDEARQAFRQLAEVEAAREEQQTQSEEVPGLLTEARMREILQEQSQAQAQQAELAKIDVETTQLGLTPGSLEHEWVLQTALTRTGGDIKKAHEQLESLIQGRVDSALEKLKNAPSTTPPVTAEGGTSIPQTQPPKTLKEARQMAMKYLSENQQAQG